MKAVVLGIGTELTQGQIVNKNASWISQKLKQLGLLTEAHLVVPDDRPLILKSLKFIEDCLSQNSESILFVTGGLGPTSDDFTRDLIAEWMGLSLEFHEPSWQHVVKALESRGLTAKEIQRQQCFFPKEAWVLENSAGTANGFYLQYKNIHVFILPGPPREIEALWTDHLHQWLTKKTTSLNIDPHLTLSWDTMGWPESEVATVTEKVLNNISGIDIGYRVHLPYVEVKLSFFKSQRSRLNSKIEELEMALSSITISKDGDDVVELLSTILKQQNYRIIVQDQYTKYYLLNRCLQAFKNRGLEILWDNSTHDQSAQFTNTGNKDVFLRLERISQHSCRLGISVGYTNQTLVLESPYKINSMAERSQQYISEKALLHLYKVLKSKHR